MEQIEYVYKKPTANGVSFPTLILLFVRKRSWIYKYWINTI